MNSLDVLNETLAGDDGQWNVATWAGRMIEVIDKSEKPENDSNTILGSNIKNFDQRNIN